MMCKYGVDRGVRTLPCCWVASESSHIRLFLPPLPFQFTSLPRAQAAPLLFLSHLSTPLWTTLPFTPCRIYFRSYSNHPLGHALLFYVNKAIEMGKLPPLRTVSMELTTTEIIAIPSSMSYLKPCVLLSRHLRDLQQWRHSPGGSALYQPVPVRNGEQNHETGA